MEFYRCNHCGEIVIKVVDRPCTPKCCGESMELLTANTVDAALEKHVPDVTVDNNIITVKVGSVEHPMIEEHFINFIAVETKQGYQIKNLYPGDKPEAVFALAEGDELKAVYEYCNLHGLWKK